MDVLGKKGILFTMISLLISAFFIIIFSANVDLPLDVQTETVSFRVSLLNNYKESWEEFIAESLRASSYRVFAGLVQDINETRKLYINSAELKMVFEQCLINETINRTADPGKLCPGVAGEGISLTHLLDTIANSTEKNIGLVTSYTVTSVDIYQKFPFDVFVEINLSYTIADAYAEISRNITVVELVPIDGIFDPLATQVIKDESIPGKPKKITPTEIRDSEWNNANFTSFINNSEYRYHQDAPSFLNRMIEITKFTPSTCCGIETVLHINIDGVVNFENASFVDHQYFYDVVDPVPTEFPGYEIFTIADPFLDDKTFVHQEHLASFNVSDDTWLIP